jgi:A/G-specific adenine glycosylase
VLAGSPPYDGPPRKGQTYEGTDRQVRGLLLAVLRAAAEPVPKAALDARWPDQAQRERALDGLVADGLVDPLPRNHYRLPA